MNLSLLQTKRLAPAMSVRDSLKLSKWRLSALILILLCSVVIRIYGIQEEPLLFHPVKQYRSAITARALYYNSVSDGTVPEWKQEVANANMRDIGVLQPPLESWIAASIYRLVGAEILWIPRLFSALMWVIGSIFLLLLARQLMPADAALVSLTFYLLLPFAVVSSQSFQIDPLMVTVTIVSLYLLVRYDKYNSLSTLLAAALVASVAILLKPTSMFILFAAFVGLRATAGKPRQMLLHWHTLVFVTISLFPTSLYYGYEIVIVKGVLQQQAVKSFVPIYFAEFRFWDGWQKRVGLVMGFTYFLGGLLGALAYEGRARVFLVALWGGYFLSCLAFNYPISTHDYYHLLLIPIVALSMGSLATVILMKLEQVGESWFWRVAMLAVLTASILFASGTSIQARRKLQVVDTPIRLAQEIGDAIGHSTNILYLAPEQGHSLLYYGEFSGRYWPYRYDIRDEELWQGRTMTVEERFEALSSAVQPQYFVVADRDEFAAQPELQHLIVDRFPVVKETDEYTIFALK